MINNNSPAIFGTPSNVQSNINGAVRNVGMELLLFMIKYYNSVN